MPTVAPVEASDLEELAELFRELCGRETNTIHLKGNFEMITQNPDYILLGAKDEQQQLIGSVMGICCMDIVADCQPFVVLENLIVSGRARGLGVGRLLVSNLEAWARARNCYYIMFTSLAKRKEAHQFYESIGYTKGIVEGFKKYL